MKILVITQHFWPENFRINDLVADFSARGHELTVLTGLPNYPQGKFFLGYGMKGPWIEWRENVKILRVPIISRGSSGALRLAFNHLSFLVCGFLGLVFRIRERFDFIFIFGSSPISGGILGVFAGWNSKAPIMFWVIDLWPDSLSAVLGLRSKLVLNPIRTIMSWIYKKCACILVQGYGFIHKVESLGVRKSCIKYFPNWVEDNYLQKVPCLPNSFFPETSNLKIMFAGNIGAAQNFDSILIAMEHLRESNIQWIFVGDGRLLMWLKDEVQKRGLQSLVHFLGQQESSKMPYLFSLADALLVSLKADPLFAVTVPGKVQSYLASGRPILAMLMGEGAGIIREAQAGLVCDSGDAEALVNNILHMKNLSASDREKLGHNGRHYAQKNFNRRVLLDYIEDLMKEMFDKNYEPQAISLVEKF